MILKHLLYENGLQIKDMAMDLGCNKDRLGQRLMKKESLRLPEIIYLINVSGMKFEEIFKEFVEE